MSDELKAGISTVCGTIGFIMGLLWLFYGYPDTYTWKIIRINLFPSNYQVTEDVTFKRSDTPQYYLLLKENGCGDCESDYLIIKDAAGCEFKVMQPNKNFYNKSGFIKKTFTLGGENGTNNIENFEGIIQWNEKTYTLGEFFENPPFEGKDPLAIRDSYPILGWIFLICAAIAILIWIPWGKIHIPRSIRSLEKDYAEFFGHMKMLLRVPGLNKVEIQVDGTEYNLNIKRSENKIKLDNYRDGIWYDFDDKKVYYRDSDDILVARQFMKNKNSFIKLYNKIADFMLDYLSGEKLSKSTLSISL